MNRRAAEFGFIALALLLNISRYLAAATCGSSQTPSSAESLQSYLGYVDRGLSLTTIAALVVGVVYIGWFEMTSREQRS